MAELRRVYEATAESVHRIAHGSLIYEITAEVHSTVSFTFFPNALGLVQLSSQNG